MANPDMVTHYKKKKKKHQRQEIKWRKTEHVQEEEMLLYLAPLHDDQSVLKVGGKFWVVLTREKWRTHYVTHAGETKTK